MTQVHTVGHRGNLHPRAVLLGVEHPRAVAAIRSLARAGMRVLAVDHESDARGFYSRYATEKVHAPADPDAQLALLNQLGQDGGGILMPTNDHYLVLASQHHEELSRHFTVTTPPWPVLEPLLDKAQAYDIARRAGLEAPLFFQPADTEDMRRIVSRLDCRNQHYILKTRIDSGPADTRTGRYTKVAGGNPDAIVANCEEIFERLGEYPMIEQVIPAEADRCIGVSMVVGLDHKPVLSFCMKRLKLFTYSRGGGFVHPYEMGANVYCESIHDDEASEAARRFVQQARYSGPITVEFRRSSVDEKLTFIKADPRFVRATSLSTAIGLDVPTALYRVFNGQQVETPRDYSDGYGWIWAIWYAETLWRNRANRSVRRELGNFTRTLRSVKSYAYWDWRDPMPFVEDVRRWGALWVQRRFGRSRPNETDTKPPRKGTIPKARAAGA